MSKTLRATCEANVVTAESVTVPAARVLSMGIGESEGILVIDEERADYFTSNASDLDESLEAMIDALGSAASGLSAASSALSTVGTTAGVNPIVLAALLVPISAAASSVESAADTLSEIKARLK